MVPLPLEPPFQFEHDGIGCEADADVTFDSVAQPMIDRTYSQVGLVHAECPLDEPQVVAIRDKLFRRIVTPR